MFLTADSLKNLNDQFQKRWDFKRTAPVSANVKKCASLDSQITRNQMSRKLSCLTFQMPLSVSHNCTTQDFHCWDWGHSQQVAPVTWWMFWLASYTHHTHALTNNSYWLNLGIPYQNPCSLIPLCNLTVVQQHKIGSNWCLRGWILNKEIPDFFMPTICVYLFQQWYLFLLVIGSCSLRVTSHTPDPFLDKGSMPIHVFFLLEAPGISLHSGHNVQCTHEAICTRCILQHQNWLFLWKRFLKDSEQNQVYQKLYQTFRWP